MSTLNGQCLCGNIKVTLKQSPPIQSAACHCYGCRTTSGSAFSLVSRVDLKDLEIKGEPATYGDSATKSGATATRHFCGKCGTPIHTTTPNDPGVTYLKLGLYAGKEPIGKPAMELFGQNREKWEEPFEGAQQA